ncbi:MAG TPA: hypothetical protein VFW12_05300 [Candidatus Limnocylindria bacterium]|nr:hypothetical protein [Candidatus Limnocylindria bacterium]
MDAAFAYRAQTAFEVLGPSIFPVHGPRNTRLDVDVVDTGTAGDVRTCIVVLPWGLEGVIFTADADFPESIVLGGRHLRVSPHAVPALGRFRTVELVDDVAPLASPRHARKVACLIGPSFRQAVERAAAERFAG